MPYTFYQLNLILVLIFLYSQSALSILLVIFPESFKSAFFIIIFVKWVFFAIAWAFIINEGALMDQVSFKVLIAAITWDYAVFNQSSINEIVRLNESLAIKFSVIKLTWLHLVIGSVEVVTTKTCHLTVKPATLISLAGANEFHDSNTGLLSVVIFSLVDITWVFDDLAEAMKLSLEPVSLQDVSSPVDAFTRSMPLVI